MKKLVSLLARGMLLAVSLMGCGNDNAQLGNAGPQTAPAVAKTYGVNMSFDLNTEKQTGKTVYGGGLIVPSILQSYKNELTHVDVYVQTSDGVDVADFEDMPIVNGVFNSI